MRWNARNSAWAVCVVAAGLFLISSTSYFSSPRCPVPKNEINLPPTLQEDDRGEIEDADLREIECVINGKESVSCLRNTEKQEIYVPFNDFLKNYFEITGKMVKDPSTGDKRFEWWHSYAKLHRPLEEKYSPTGVFGPFDSYNVEARERVKCISGSDGVPMSIQWGPKPYFYPIQVAQYALEHYSKNITDEEPSIANIPCNKNFWSIPPDFASGAKVAPFFDDMHKDSVLLTSAESLENPGIFLSLDNGPLHVLQFSILLLSNASFTVTAERLDTQEFVHLHYMQYKESNCILPLSHNSFVYGIGTGYRNQWTSFTRDILTDLNRAIAAVPGPKKRKSNGKVTKLPADYLRLVSLSVRGGAKVAGSVLQQSSAHLAQFLLGADWLTASQDEAGGWPINVRRSLSKDRLVLEPGWYSAMAQGHAMSVLCRAYYITKDEAYLEAARKATKLFDVDARDGGVRNWLFGKFPWYEEYPTSPGSFVLNGFIYSLLGLYDLSKTEASHNSTAFRLYSEGLRTLKTALPLFDTGSGTVYDLRHLSIDVPPNLARWDYHAVHIYQLWWLYNIESDEMLRTFAERWTAYSRGERAKHN